MIGELDLKVSWSILDLIESEGELKHRLIVRYHNSLGVFQSLYMLEVSQDLELKRSLCYMNISILQSFHSGSPSPKWATNFLPFGHLALSSITVTKISFSGSPCIVTE